MRADTPSANGEQMNWDMGIVGRLLTRAQKQSENQMICISAKPYVNQMGIWRTLGSTSKNIRINIDTYPFGSVDAFLNMIGVNRHISCPIAVVNTSRCAKCVDSHFMFVSKI